MTFAGAITLIGSKLLAFVPLRLIAAVSGPLSTLGWWLEIAPSRGADQSALVLSGKVRRRTRGHRARGHFRAYVQAALGAWLFCGTPAVSASGNM